MIIEGVHSRKAGQRMSGLHFYPVYLKRLTKNKKKNLNLTK